MAIEYRHLSDDTTLLKLHSFVNKLPSFNMHVLLSDLKALRPLLVYILSTLLIAEIQNRFDEMTQ